MMTSLKHTIKTKGGLQLFGTNHTHENPRSVLLVVHGFGEHSGRYKHVAQFFNSHQIALVAFDRSGEGQSEGRKGHAESYELLYDELSLWLEYTKSYYKGIPIYMYGHSLGGNILMNYMFKVKPDVEGFIFTGPWIELAMKPPPVQMFLLPILSRLLPRVANESGIDVSNLSTDLAVGEAYKKDDFVNGAMTFKLADLILKNAKDLLGKELKIEKPMLLMHGIEDAIISVNGSRQLVDIHQNAIDYKEWPGMRHEIHNEVDKLSVFNHTLAWLNKNINR